MINLSLEECLGKLQEATEEIITLQEFLVKKKRRKERERKMRNPPRR